MLREELFNFMVTQLLDINCVDVCVCFVNNASGKHHCLNSILNILYYLFGRGTWKDSPQKWYYWIKCMNE